MAERVGQDQGFRARPNLETNPGGVTIVRIPSETKIKDLADPAMVTRWWPNTRGFYTTSAQRLGVLSETKIKDPMHWQWWPNTRRSATSIQGVRVPSDTQLADAGDWPLSRHLAVFGYKALHTVNTHSFHAVQLIFFGLGQESHVHNVLSVVAEGWTISSSWRLFTCTLHYFWGFSFLLGLFPSGRFFFFFLRFFLAKNTAS